MTAAAAPVLTINGGSSSIKFALYGAGADPERRLAGAVERIGRSGTTLSVVARGRRESRPLPAGDHGAAAHALLDWLEADGSIAGVAAVGHRVVHGMAHSDPERVTPALLDELRGIAAIDPDHMPMEIALIELLAQRHPTLPQVACFDTAFHRSMPRVAQLLPIPRRYDAQGIRRYGFHGLSYAYLMEELGRVDGAVAAGGRVVLAHLGSGSSMAAVRDGRSIDTSMGFTPSAGLPMGTRSGDLDPGLAAYLERSEHLTAGQFFAMASRESGLLGVSETSADLRDLLAQEATDVRAAEAVALFCYRAKKCVGAYAAALGGLDTLVFAGGIGENAAAVRARICDGLGFLGIELDAARNEAHGDVISTVASRATVRVIRTDEERMIARSVCRILRLGG
ncbi:MAG: acetate/propionate family kinase [Pseudomonadota bacterium]|nr:acetate/propionate family kinase [Pseudomonadota bacterium]